MLATLGTLGCTIPITMPSGPVDATSFIFWGRLEQNKHLEGILTMENMVPKKCTLFWANPY